MQENTNAHVGFISSCFDQCYSHTPFYLPVKHARLANFFIKMSERLAFLLIGDHLGQIKKVSYPNGKVTVLDNCAEPAKSKPVVSIEPIQNSKHQLIAHKNGELYLYDPIYDTTKACEQANEDLVKALPISQKKTLFVHEKRVISESKKDFIYLKRGIIHNAQVQNNEIAIVGKDIPLKIFDINTRRNTFEADPPEKNWLGIRPDIYVAGLSYVAQTRVATCSKSDSVIRIYDTKSKPKPIISVDINQTAFNEHADSARFLSVASTGDQGHCIVVGSNIGQIFAIDLRFNVKQVPKKKKLQPKRHKILGSFKGSRGGSIKDIVIVPAFEENKSASSSDDDDHEEESEVEDISVGKKSQVGYKVISCCLDRYLRIHNFTKTSRNLDKHVYMNTKPLVCSPVFYES